MREKAAFAQATATKAMADAMLQKAHAMLQQAQAMADQNLYMLMTYSTDGVISETAARYLKLRQEEELQKLKARLAKSRAREAGARRTPTPIPVANALGHGIVNLCFNLVVTLLLPLSHFHCIAAFHVAIKVSKCHHYCHCVYILAMLFLFQLQESGSLLLGAEGSLQLKRPC